MTKQEFEDARAALEPGDIETALKVIPVAATALQFTQQVDRYYRYIRELVPGRVVFDTDDGYRVTVSVSVEKVEQ